MSGVPPWVSRHGPSGWSATPVQTSLPTETNMWKLPSGPFTTEGAQTTAALEVGLVHAFLVGQLSGRQVQFLKSDDSQAPSVLYGNIRALRTEGMR